MALTDEDNAAAKSVYEVTGGQPSDKGDVSYWWQLS